MDKTQLLKVFGGALSKNGFKRKSMTWHRLENGVLHVVNLQRSSYSALYFVNISCVPAGMIVEGAPTPREYKCPFRLRIEAIKTEDIAEIARAFDLEDQSIDDADRVCRINTIINEVLLPFFAKLNSNEALKIAIEDGLFNCIDVDGRKYLGIEK